MKKLMGTLLALVCLVGLPVSALADTGEHSTEIPVTLTIIHSTKNIDVTMPATMPVSVIDGKVLTANNVEIKNNSRYLGVEIAGIRVENGSYTIDNFETFDENSQNCIAMQINGCNTVEAGNLNINKTAFPDIKPSTNLPITYNAKVSDGEDIAEAQVASVVFILKAIETNK